MDIKSARFVTTATRPGQYPPAGPCEVAFAGRSNVGKSSLINCLCRTKKLVKTSQTPGRTQHLNFFDVNNGAFCLADLPGFGYARVSKAMRQQWQVMVRTYFQTREPLAAVVLIVDLRRGPEAEEQDLAAWLWEMGISVLPVATKADKAPASKRAAMARAVDQAFGNTYRPAVVFSSKTGLGREKLWEQIMEVCALTEPDHE